MPHFARRAAACGGFTCFAGGAMAVAMQVSGGALAPLLPPAGPFIGSAMCGAGCAGAALAGGFGHGRWYGHLAAVVAWPLATGIGAAVAGTIATVIAEGAGAATTGDGPALGLIAVLDGVTGSPVVLAVWLASGLAVQRAMLRHRRPRFA